MIRPEWVEAGARAIVDLHAHHGQYPPHTLAGVVLVAIEPLIRADERDRTATAWNEVSVELYERLIHAEAVAARLVEVICEQEERISAYARHINLQAGRINEGWVVADNLRAQTAADILAAIPVADRSEFMTYLDGYRIGMTDAADIARGMP